MLREGVGTNPFPGLRPFEAEEGHLFFGREGQSEELFARLRTRRLLAVVGTSGSGKSSLVRAGLIPLLRRSSASTGQKWRIATLRPGDDPIHGLAVALDKPDVIGKTAASEEEAAREATLLEVRLRRSGLGLKEVVHLARLGPQESVLIIIDQFEELFRFVAAGASQSDAAAFVKLLLEATWQTELPIYVVLTMRSDFIGDCSRFYSLPEAVAAGLYLIPRLTRAQRRAAIVKPVEAAGAQIAQRLVNRILNDIGEDPDQLPVMQHALMRTWDHWAKRVRGDASAGATTEASGPLDLEDYVAIGTAAEALSMHAEEAFGALDEKGRDLARRTFQCLTEKGADNREVRRPTRLATIADVAGTSLAEVMAVIEEFRKPERSFLMPPASVALNEASVIDISHESLIRHWKRLSGWVEQEQEWAKSYRHLAETAALHQQGRAGLWGDPDLTEYLEWKERTKPTQAWAERYHPGFKAAIDFLEDSRIARDRAQQARKRRRRAAAGALVGVIVGLSGMASVALVGWNRAVHDEDLLKEETKALNDQKTALEEEDRTLKVTAAQLKQRTAEAIDEKNYALEKEKEANEAKQNALTERDAAIRARNDAQRADQDAAQVARLSRQELTDGRQDNEDDLDDLLSWAPPAWSAYIHGRKAQVREGLGKFAAARADLDAELQAAPDYLPALVESSDDYLVIGDAEAALRDAQAYLAVIRTDAVGYANLMIAQAMRHHYPEAIKAIDEALENARLPQGGTESFVAPDIQTLTRSFDFRVDDTDFLLALQYAKAMLYAMSGDDRFGDAFEKADHADGDCPFSRDAYLLALNWGWLIIRGQGLYDLRTRSKEVSNAALELKDYGAYQAEGALWERVARTRPGAGKWAQRAYDRFREAYAHSPDARYQSLAAWAAPGGACKVEAGDPEGASLKEREDAILDKAREEALRADEIKNQASDDTDVIALAPAHEKLSDAITRLEKERSAGRLGRRGKDLLVRLLLRRGNWRLKGMDKGAAAHDAQEALAIGGKMAKAYSLLARAAFDDAARQSGDEQALALEPYNPDALQDLAELAEKNGSLPLALDLMQKRRRVVRYWSDDYLRMARLQEQLNQSDGALQSIQRAIASAPWRVDLYEMRRELESKAGVDGNKAQLHFDEGLRRAGDIDAETGNGVAALKAYVRAFREISRLPSDDDASFELETVIRNLSAFLSTRSSVADVAQFWQSLARDPLLDQRQHELATKEADRLVRLGPDRDPG